jgi:hypothetical protein
MILDYITVFIVIYLGTRLTTAFGFLPKDSKRLKLMWIYHLFFGVVYYYFILSQGGSDSLKYWEGAKQLTADQALSILLQSRGTQAMYAVNFLPSSLLGLSFFSGTMIYSLIGFLGIIFFYKIAIEAVPLNYKFIYTFLFPAIFYLPNLHFWSVAIGKDTLLFFAVGLFCFSLMNGRKRWSGLLISSLCAFVIRPHIFLFLLVGFSVAYLLDTKIETYKRVLLFLILATGSLAILPSVLKYTQMEELSVESINQFSEMKVANLSRSHTGSSVDISNYPLPLKMFTFLYRPTFTDINGLPSIMAAVENFLLLILTVVVLRRKPLETFKKAPFIVKGLFVFLIVGTITFSMSLGNLGIMLRMRNMFLPGMLIYICWSFSYYLQTNVLSRITTFKLVK